jgi:hypothetical protein
MAVSNLESVLFYRALAISRVTVSGNEFLLQEGNGVLEIAARRCAGKGYVHFELKLLSTMSVSALAINRVSVVSES